VFLRADAVAQEIIMGLRARVFSGVMAVVTSMFLVACGGSYNCQVSFGSGCSSSGTQGFGGSGGTGGTGGGGGGSSTPSAFVFAIDQAGTIDGYTLNNSASTFQATSSYVAPTVPANDGGRGLVVANQLYLYAGFGDTETLYGWTIGASGGLTAVSGSPYAATFMSLIGNGSGTSSIITNPAGTFLFLAATVPGEIYVYQIGSGGALTAVTGSPFAAGMEPVNLTTDGLGKYLYATNGGTDHLGTEVAAFAIGNNGALTTVPGSPFAFPMWQVLGEPTGNFLIGTTGQSAGVNGSDNDFLYVFTIQPSGASAGAITQVANSPFATQNSPFSLAVQPDAGGNLVYSFGFNVDLTGFNSPEAFSIDPTTGALSEISGSPFSNAALGTWGQFDQSGTNLLLWGEVNSSGTFTYPLSALQVGTNGALTQPTTTIDLATQGYWAVTDPPAN
jgi:hypothetical protein